MKRHQILDISAPASYKPVIFPKYRHKTRVQGYTAAREFTRTAAKLFWNFTVTNEELIHKAISVLNPRKISSFGAEAAGVGCALKTATGNIFTGVCIDVPCGIGFCAEHSAIAAMITAGETAIDTIVAVDWDKSVLSPCGRCREFMYQIDDNNQNTNVIMPNGQTMTLKNLLPHHWCEKKAA